MPRVILPLKITICFFLFENLLFRWILGSCEVKCFVLWEFSLRLLDGKEEPDWFKVFECWSLDFADIVLRTVFWVSTSFLIVSSFVQRLYFKRKIFSKDFSCWLGTLPLTSLLKYSEKESIFFFKRANSEFTNLFNS